MQPDVNEAPDATSSNDALNATPPDPNAPDAGGANNGTPPTGESSSSTQDVQKLIRDRQKANREAAAAKKRLAELEAAEEERKRAKMEENDRLRLEKKEASDALAAKEAEILRANNVNAALKAGVNPEYSDFVANQMAAALAADPSLDKSAWLAKEKESRPAFFGSQKVVAPAPSSAEGGIAPGGPKISDRDKNIMSLEAELKDLDPVRYRDRVHWLKREIRVLKKNNDSIYDREKARSHLRRK